MLDSESNNPTFHGSVPTHSAVDLGMDCLNRFPSVEAALLRNPTLRAEIVLAVIYRLIETDANVVSLTAIVGLGETLDRVYAKELR